MRITEKHSLYVAAAILLSFVFLSVSFSASNSAVWDEPTHLSNGYYFLKTGDFSMNPSHPPLTHYLFAMPLLFTDAKLQANAGSYTNYSYVAFAHDFVFGQISNPDRAVFTGRLFFTALGAILGFFVFLWARKLYGSASGLTALALYSFSPVVIAFSSLALTDITITAFYFLTVFSLFYYLKNPSVRKLLLTGLLLGLAMVSKFTALYLFPVIAILLIVRRRELMLPFKVPFESKLEKKAAVWRIAVFMAVIAAIAFAVIFIFYQFQFTTLSEAVPGRFLERGYELLPSLKGPAQFIAEKVPLPAAAYIGGVIEQGFISSATVKESFLVGEVYAGGKWQFHLIGFALKNTLPFLIILAASLLLFKRARSKISNEAFLLVPALFYIAAFMLNSINSGMQHILPAMPFLFVFASKIAKIRFAKRNLNIAFAVLLAVLLAWHVYSVISMHPHELAYFNEIAGKEDGYKYFVGANLDLGQDFRGLMRYVKENSISDLKLSYFGTNDPYYYGLNFTYLPSPFFQPWVSGYAPLKQMLSSGYSEDCSERAGMIAISATNLQGVNLLNKSCYDWLRKYRPIAKIGRSIFVYNITEQARFK
ncbi:glycosyltransferase family 39 protein [Candidatus Woesearchaeota archaeon]|nr:glycosyltransferase family 39 protein [Candidatus Woesearchaeota archaeon]